MIRNSSDMLRHRVPVRKSWAPVLADKLRLVHLVEKHTSLCQAVAKWCKHCPINGQQMREFDNAQMQAIYYSNIPVVIAISSIDTYLTWKAAGRVVYHGLYQSIVPLLAGAKPDLKQELFDLLTHKAVSQDNSLAIAQLVHYYRACGNLRPSWPAAVRAQAAQDGSHKVLEIMSSLE